MAHKVCLLVIQPSGAKSWAMRFRRPNGQPAKLTLGTVDLSGKELKDKPEIGMPLSLPRRASLPLKCIASARWAVMLLQITPLPGTDGGSSKRGAANTFGILAPQFIEEHARPKTRRWRDTARLLGLRYPKDGGEPEKIAGGLLQRWADRPVREIDGHDVWSVVDETRRIGAPGLERRSDRPTEPRARVMSSCLSKMFSWLVQNRKVEKNPCIGVHRPDAPKARDRVLTDAEIVAFWHACDKAVGDPFGQLLKLLLLTGSRLNEVAGMTRAELSEDGTTWSIPGKRTKNGRPHVVPLPPLARAVLATVKPIAGKAGLGVLDHRRYARERMVQNQGTPRRGDEDFSMAVARPTPHGRDRDGRNRYRPTHR